MEPYLASRSQSCKTRLLGLFWRHRGRCSDELHRHASPFSHSPAISHLTRLTSTHGTPITMRFSGLDMGPDLCVSRISASLLSWLCAAAARLDLYMYSTSPPPCRARSLSSPRVLSHLCVVNNTSLLRLVDAAGSSVAATFVHPFPFFSCVAPFFAHTGIGSSIAPDIPDLGQTAQSCCTQIFINH